MKVRTRTRAWLAVVAAIVLLGSQAAASPSRTDAALRAFRESRFDDLEKRLSEYFALRHGAQADASAFDDAIWRTAKAIDLDPALAPRLERWRTAKPKSAWPHLVRAQLEIRRAWDARGGGFANTVNDRGWEGFRKHVAAADAALVQALATDPRDLPSAVLRIETALLGSAGVDVVFARFQDALAIDPASEAAHRAMFRALSENWLGSKEIGLEFAREAVRQQPDAPRLGLLLVDAHDILAQKRGPEVLSAPFVYFRKPGTWEEVGPALERYVAANPRDPWGHNRLAWLAWRSGKRDVAKREFAVLRGHFVEEAWDENSSPEQAELWANAVPAAGVGE